tara:strand:+ start:1268 stop:1546 length:279 start_codon:yes stop_codon:yes gene_type:complete
MPLFRNFEECKSIVSLMLGDFSEEGRKKIEDTIIYCQYLDSDADKTFALTRSVKKQLWDIPKAVDIGFVEYLKEKVLEISILIEYQKVNNDE